MASFLFGLLLLPFFPLTEYNAYVEKILSRDLYSSLIFTGEQARTAAPKPRSGTSAAPRSLPAPSQPSESRGAQVPGPWPQSATPVGGQQSWRTGKTLTYELEPTHVCSAGSSPAERKRKQSPSSRPSGLPAPPLGSASGFPGALAASGGRGRPWRSAGRAPT